MKMNWSKSLLLLALVSFMSFEAGAQAKKKPAPKKTTAKQSAAKKATSQVLDAQQAAPKQDTVPPPPPPAPPKDPFAFDSVRVSLRPDASIERGLVKDRTPLAYEHIREDDAWYRERVWREIDIREK